VDREAAEADLRAAADVFRERGAEPLLAAATTLARQARVTLPAEASPGGDASAETPTAVDTLPGDGRAPGVERRPSSAVALSARELEVLALVADGRSNGEIADALFISRKTASVHVSHILDKLGVASRVEAAIVGARLGLVAPASADVEELSRPAARVERSRTPR
jgi:DNA-binding CsgD family transcriptional regulator